MTKSPTVRWLALLLATSSFAFAWGFLSHRERAFPFHQLRAAAWSLGVLDRPGRQPIQSPSPAVDLLAALPYVDAMPAADPERRGVVLRRPEAQPGFNLYPSAVAGEAWLIDMDGEVVHRWSSDEGPWQHVELLDDGGLLVLLDDRGLRRLDLRSRSVWSLDLPVHHDFDVDDRGTIYVLTRETRMLPRHHPTEPIWEDAVTLVSAGGEVLETISILELVETSPYAFLLPRADDLELDPETRGLDLLHTNHVEVFDGRLAARSPIYRRGNLLLSMRHVNAVVIVDGESREIVWIWGPSNLAFQHQPTLLDNGHLLIFDNGVERSRVIELDPLSRRIVWSWAPAEGFFSAGWGGVQRLPGGNTLITESQAGNVFEVTPAGDVVWHFANPAFTDRGERVAIWRMVRHDSATLAFLPRP